MFTRSAQSMFDVQNIYGTPQIPRKRPCLRPRRMTLIDLRNVPLTEEDTPYRKASSGTIKSEGAACHYTKHGIQPIYDSSESLASRHSSTSMRSKHSTSVLDGSTRFPKLEECAHFHYDTVEIKTLQVTLCEDGREMFRHNGTDLGEFSYLLQVSSNDKTWNLRRTYANFCMLDRQLHRCIFDRKFSHLSELHRDEESKKTKMEMDQLLQRYLGRFSEISGNMLNCGSVLNWLEIDNRGNRLLAVDDSGINTPAIAAAHAVKRYNAQAADEISLEVGDIVSVIDMPTPEETIWWRGKRGFEVGFFPSECVEVIGDKVPQSMASRIPEPDAAKKPLMKKHGKLMSFLRTFFSTRPARNQLKQSGIVKERVFGCDLGEHLLNSGHDVPLVLKSCAEVIEQHGVVDGIYRLSGITSNIQKLRLAFDEDRVPDLTDDCYLQDIHSISSLLKMYFRELPNPLLTYQLYDKFADAVRDEDNKLLRIHDVVQQLPPPHYRTTEYLMRHLARVASQGHETGMHSKNLAIVWAPNLLRSKELEMGGGAAALQGVGIQAVVTECLICYCDIIFSDKMPSYSSPQLQKSQKKPRPKSLAISTPTRLLSLEEARERAFIGNLAPSQKYIDVGGGPDNLPSKYHTVIDLPGYRKKKPDSTKMKKSPVSGWKSFFSKPRSGSIKKARKSSIQESVNLTSIPAKALTEEDVHNWKKRLRNAKSAESLLSLASSNRSSGSRMGKASDNFMVVNVYGEEKLPHAHSPRIHHKRSLSSDATTVLHLRSFDAMDFNGSREVPIDVDVSVAPDDPPPRSSPRKSRTRKDEPERKQSFIRGDNTRRALHRRTPSAPSTPRRDRSSSGSRRSEHDGRGRRPDDRQASASHPALGSPDLNSHVRSQCGYSSDESLDVNLPPENVSKLHSSRDNSSTHSSPHSRSEGSEELVSQKRSARTPPKGRKKAKGSDDTEVSMTSKPRTDEVLTVKLQESPRARRKVELIRKDPSLAHSATDEGRKKYFYSRHHDYAEIDSSEEEETVSSYQSTIRETAIISPDNSMPDLARHAQNMPTQKSNFQHPVSTVHSTEPTYAFIQKQGTGREVNKWPSEQDDQRKMQLKFQEYGPSHGNQGRSPELRTGNISDITNLEERLQQMQQLAPHASISKCLSVPSDIAKSLENVTMGSQSDLLSSVTISELSQSVDSFNLSFSEDNSEAIERRRRRSASLDSMNGADSQLSRTLREINLQIDKAFKRDVTRALELESAGYHRHGSTENVNSLYISEDAVTPTNSLETHFPGTSLDVPLSPGTILSSNLSQKGKRASTPSEFIEVIDPLQSNYGHMHPVPHREIRQANSPVERHIGEEMGRERSNSDLPLQVDRHAEIQIVETPQVVRVPGGSEKSTSIHASSSSGSSSTSSTEDSEDSVDFTCGEISSVTSASSVGKPEQTRQSHMKAQPASVLSSQVDIGVNQHAGVSSGVPMVSCEVVPNNKTVQWQQNPFFLRKDGELQSPRAGPRARHNHFGARSTDYSEIENNDLISSDISRESLSISPTAGSSRFRKDNALSTSGSSSIEGSPRSSPCLRQSSSNASLGSIPEQPYPSDNTSYISQRSLDGGIHTVPSPMSPKQHSLVSLTTSAPLPDSNPHYFDSRFTSGQLPTSMSLPEVHVLQDTVIMEKPIIKKSGTESQLGRSLESSCHRYAEEQIEVAAPRVLKKLSGTSVQGKANVATSKTHKGICSVPPQHMDTGSNSVVSSIDKDFSFLQQELTQSQELLHIYEDSSLPGDENLDQCRMRRASSSTSSSSTVKGHPSSPPMMEIESTVEVSLHQAAAPSGLAIDRRYHESEVNSSGPTMETRLLRVESFGEVDPEVFQNAVNTGKELLMSPHIAGRKGGTREVLIQHSPVVSMETEAPLVPASTIIKPVEKCTLQQGPVLKAPGMSDFHDGHHLSQKVMPAVAGIHRAPASRQDLPPPKQEVLEMTRPSLIRSGSKSSHDSDSEKSVVVKEIASDNRGARLIIEKRPGMKDHIHTVHAKKVPQPPRLVAEAVDSGATDTSDSMTIDLSSTGPSDPEPSGLSSQEDEVFSDSTEGRRDFVLDSRSALRAMSKGVEDLVGSRSSLDESVLQLAAERHGAYDAQDQDDQSSYGTGSLRARRSQKMQNLMDLFERGSDSSQGDTPGTSPTIRHKERSLSASGGVSFSLCLAEDSHRDAEQDTDEENVYFTAGSPRLRQRSRSRERMHRANLAGSDKENRIISRSPTPTRQRASALTERRMDHDMDLPPSPAEVRAELRSKRQVSRGSKTEKFSSFGRPPRYRSSSRGRTHSESSTSESEGCHHHDGIGGIVSGRMSDTSSSSDGVLKDQNRTERRARDRRDSSSDRGVDRRSQASRSTGEEGSSGSEGRSSSQRGAEGRSDLQRRGSIKELMEFFENRQSDPVSEEHVISSGVSQSRTGRGRLRSASPAHEEAVNTSPGVMRASQELYSSVNPGPQLESSLMKTQPLRLGPKPFYGAKK